MQQGDTLGPLLFCLAIHRHCEQLRSPLSAMYLDDVSVGGSMDDGLHDLDMIKASENLGLFLNCSKCEVICNDDTVRGHIASALPGAMVVNPESACLLGTPLGDVASIDASLEEKIRALISWVVGSHICLPMTLSPCCVTRLRFPSCTTYYAQLLAFCHTIWRSTIPPYAPFSALSPTHPCYKMTKPGCKLLSLLGLEAWE